MEFIRHGVLSFDVEDSGCAIIGHLLNLDESDEPDSGMFVRVQSWDESLHHTEIRKLAGKYVEVTMRIIDDAPPMHAAIITSDKFPTPNEEK
jgi:hypothetical protein